MPPERGHSGAHGSNAFRLTVAVLLVAIIGALMGSLMVACSKSKSSSSTSSSSTAARPTGVSTVEVWGDSLTLQAARALRAEGTAHGLSVTVLAYYGLAPCDVARVVHQHLEHPPAAMVLAFTGNNFSPCMQHAGVSLVGPEYFAAYRRDMEDLITDANARGVPVLIVGAPTFPLTENHPDRVDLNALYAQLAIEHSGTRYVATVSALGTDAFSLSAPCVAGETAALGCERGQIVVRSGNGIHLDPTRSVPCPTGRGECQYSAGSHRYANAILTALGKVPSLSYHSVAAATDVPIPGAGEG